MRCCGSARRARGGAGGDVCDARIVAGRQAPGALGGACSGGSLRPSAVGMRGRRCSRSCT